MLYFIAVWLVLGSGCAVVGLTLLNLLQANYFARSSDRLIAAIWLGLLLFANLLLALSTLLPLSSLVGAAAFVGAVEIALLRRSTRIELQKLSFDRAWIVAIASVMVSIAAITSRQVTWIDTGLYHYGMVQWLAQYGSVPGVALLFANFGFTSAWFALAAPFDFGMFAARVTSMGNGFVLLLAIAHFLLAARSIQQRQAQLSDWFAIAFWSLTVPLVLASGLLSEILVSPSPDVAALLLTGVVAWAILVIAGDPVPQARDRAQPSSSVVPLLLAVGAVTIKLVTLPLLLVAGCFWLVQSWQNLPRLLIGGAGAIALLMPLLASSVITSGCPLYPSTAMCFDLPWSPTDLVRSQVAAGTHQWTSWYGASAAGLRGFFWALWQWFNASASNKLIVLLIVVSLIAIAFVVKTVRLDRQFGLLWVAAIAISGTGFLLLTSPLLRFVLAYVMLLPALLLALGGQRWSAIWPKRWSKKWPRRSIWLSPLVAAIVTVTALQSQPLRLILPPPMQRVGTVQKQLNDFRYYSPIADVCWATPLPCAFTVTPDVKLRDRQQGIKAGFVRR